MSIKKHLIVVGALTSLLSHTAYAAGFAEGELYVSATGANLKCEVSSAELNFGTYDGSNDLHGKTNLKVICSNKRDAVPITLKIKPNDSDGLKSHLSDGTSKLAYKLYTDESRTRELDANTGMTENTIRGSGVAMFAVHGTIPAGQDYTTGGSYKGINTVIAEF